MSLATEAVIFQTTAEDDTGITKPLGNVQMMPTPIVAAEFQRLANTNGTVGEVAHDSAVVVTQTGDPGSSLIGVLVPPGVTPIACGLPKPRDWAVAVAWMIESSSKVARTAAVVRISRQA